VQADDREATVEEERGRMCGGRRATSKSCTNVSGLPREGKKKRRCVLDRSCDCIIERLKKREESGITRVRFHLHSNRRCGDQVVERIKRKIKKVTIPSPEYRNLEPS